MITNISFFVSTLGSGGAEKQAALLANILSYKYKVLFVVLYGDYDMSPSVLDILRNSNAQLILLKGSWLRKMLNFKNILNSNHINCSFNYLTQCDFWGSILERISGVRKIYNGIRNSEMEKYKILLEYISHNFIATGTIFNCYSGKKNFIDLGFKKGKCKTIPNCFPYIECPCHRVDKSVKNIITVGRFVPQKDYETAIKIIATLKKVRCDFVFHIVGYGALEEQIRKWVEEYDISDVVMFHIKSNDIPLLLQQSDIYLSTSLFEGTSNSIMEAMNWSLPVVATNVGDNKFLVIDNVSGMLHPIKDVFGMSYSLDVLLSDLNLRNRMGIEGNLNLKKKYSIEVFLKKYLDVIEAL